jgi:hypothetical protein
MLEQHRAKGVGSRESNRYSITDAAIPLNTW